MQTLPKACLQVTYLHYRWATIWGIWMRWKAEFGGNWASASSFSLRHYCTEDAGSAAVRRLFSSLSAWEDEPKPNWSKEEDTIPKEKGSAQTWEEPLSAICQTLHVSEKQSHGALLSVLGSIHCKQERDASLGGLRRAGSIWRENPAPWY